MLNQDRVLVHQICHQGSVRPMLIKASVIVFILSCLFACAPSLYSVNLKYESTNNAFSLLMAREFFNVGSAEKKPLDRLLLMDADIVFSPHLLPFLLGEGSPNRIAVRVAGRHDEEEVRVKVDASGNVLVIGKTMPLSDAYGESIGIEFFSSHAAQRLSETIEQRVRSGEGRHEFYEASFQATIDHEIHFKAVDVSSFPAIEIDTLADLCAAEALVMTQRDPSKNS